MNENTNCRGPGFNGSPSVAAGLPFLIIGQGLCGTFLSYYLMKAGINVLVIDEPRPFTASRVASGVINPVTGRRIVRTWRIEELLPYALQAYATLGSELGVSLVKKCSLLDFHPGLQMKEAFEKRVSEETEYLHLLADDQWQQHFNYFYGVGEVSPCLLIDLKLMLGMWRKKLQEQNALLDEKFDQQELQVYNDHVTYKNITAQKIIYCDGVAGVTNPYFKNLPFAPNKGEALLVRIPGLPKENIYKQGISIVPWNDDLFWIGSSYEWNFQHDEPTDAFKKRIENQLKYWLKLHFEVVDHLASVRPANIERRPFVGIHPQHPSVGVFNGMGTKGCSLAPFFAKQLTDYLVEGKPIYEDADVRRFEKVLAKQMN
jgi:glycine/D-amino acid oxidase-like deaminating enzyme